MYGCRNGELRQAGKSHFDFNKGVWTIPPEKHKLGKKSGKPLLRPITPTIKGYLKQAFEISAESAYVFTNGGSNEVMGVRAPLAIPYNVMQYLRRHEGYEMEHWSMHVLRKSARTRFSEITQFHIAEVMLSHAQRTELDKLHQPPRSLVAGCLRVTLRCGRSEFRLVYQYSFLMRQPQIDN